MSVRRTSKNGMSSSKVRAKIQRLRDKAFRLSERIKASNFRVVSRYESRRTWWQLAFRTPLVGFYGWVFSRANTLWAAYMTLLGLSGKSGKTLLASRHGEVKRSKRDKQRGLQLEGLEQRQLMAADLDGITPGIYSDNAGSAPDLAVTNVANPTVSVKDSDPANLFILVDANGDGLYQTGESVLNAVPGTSYSLAVTAPGTVAAQGVAVLPPDGTAITAEDSVVISLDNVAPTAAINQSTSQFDPSTTALPVKFSLFFSEPINTATFSAADLTVLGTASGFLAPTVTSVTDMKVDFQVTSPFTETITAQFTGSVTDLVGNASASGDFSKEQIASSFFPAFNFANPAFEFTAALSQFNTGLVTPPNLPNIGTTYDNFSLSSPTPIAGFNWVGKYASSTTGLNPEFKIRIYSDSAGQPGALLSEVFVGKGAEQPVIGQPLTFHYSAAINPQVLPAGNYWVSIVAQLPSSTDTWGLAYSNTNGDVISYRDFLNTSTFTVDRVADTVDYAIVVNDRRVSTNTSLLPYVVTLDANDTPPAEGGPNGQFKVLLTNNAGAPFTALAPVVITYAVDNSPGNAKPAAAPGGSLTDPNDYQTLSGAVTIPAGQTFANIDVIAFEDGTSENENEELVALRLTSVAGNPVASGFVGLTPPGVAPIGTVAQTLKIIDNDTSVITITAPDNLINKENTVGETGTFRVALTSPTATPTVVELKVPQNVTNNALFAPSGSHAKDYDVVVSGGGSLVTLTAATRTIATVERLNNVATLTFTGGNPYSVGQQISVDAANNSFDVGAAVITAVTANSVSYANIGANVSQTTNSGPITRLTNQTLTVPAGVTEVFLTVLPVGDTTVERDEVIDITLDRIATGSPTIGAAKQATMTIIDDDASVATLATNDPNASDPNSLPAGNAFPSADNGIITVQLSNPASENTVLTYSIAQTALSRTVFSENFDAGGLPRFTTVTGGNGQIGNVVQSGSDRALQMRRTTASSGNNQMTSSNTATFQVDLSQAKLGGGAVFTVNHTRLSNADNQALPGTPFAGTTPWESFTGVPQGDGVAISTDGENWFSLGMDLVNSGVQTFDLERALVQNSLPFGNLFIRFFQFHNTGAFTNNSTSGREFDDINVFVGDYRPVIGSTATFGTVTVAANATQASINIQTINDLVVESTEFVTVTLNPAVSSGNPDISVDPIVGNRLQTVTITDLDTAEAVITNGGNGNELGLVAGKFNVTLTNPHGLNMRSATNTVIPFQVVGIASPTATYNVDYTISGGNVIAFNPSTMKGSLLIPAGETQGSITVNVLQDNVVEDDEFVSVQLLNSGSDLIIGDPDISVSSTPATLAILDEDAAFIRINNAADGKESGPNGKFIVDLVRTVDLVNPVNPLVNVTSSSNTVVTFDVLTSSTATPGAFPTPLGPNDYAELTFAGKGTVTIPAGQSTAAIDVSVFDDLLLEPTETVVVKLDTKIFGDSSVFILASQNTDTVRIFDNDTIALKVAAGTNGQERGAAIVSRQSVGLTRIITTANPIPGLTIGDRIALTLTPVDPIYPNGVVTVTSVSGNTFTYAVSSGSFNVGPSVSTGLASLNTLGADVLNDNLDGSFTIFLDGDATIINDYRSKMAGSNIVVRYSMSGTAANGVDYRTLNGTATIAAGASSTTIRVDVLDDLVFDPNETVTLTLTNVVSQPALGLNGQGVVVDSGLNKSATISIIDDEVGQVQLKVTKNARESNTNGEITFTLPGPSATPTVVNYAVTPSGPAPTATQGADHNLFSGKVTFLPNQTEVRVVVPVLNDNIKETTEFIPVQITGFDFGGNGGGFLFDPTPVLVPILHDQTVDIVRTYDGREGNVTANVTAKSLTSGVATLRIESLEPTSNLYQVGQTVTVAIGDPVFDGNVVITAVTGNTISYAKVNSNVVFTPIFFGTVSNNPAFVIGMQTPSTADTVVTYQLMPFTWTAVSKAKTGSTATITTSTPHNMAIGQTVNVALTPADPVFDGSYVITAVTANSFSYARGGDAVSLRETLGAVTRPQGDAQNGIDYSILAPFAVTIPAGQTTVQITLAVNDDTVIELDERVTIKLLTVTNIADPDITIGEGALVPNSIEIEGVNDAGQLPATARVTNGSYALNQIIGTIGGLSAPDMYLIQIDNPAAFSASTVSGGGLNPQLFLFRADGTGVVSSDNFVGNEATIGVPADSLVTTPGLYYLAISPSGVNPTSGGNNIWFTNNNVAPNGAGAFGAVNGWTGTGAGGSYTINLAGVSFASYDASASLTIFDNDAGYIQVSGVDGKEGGPNATFTITQSLPASTPTVVTYTLGGTATPAGTNQDHSLTYSGLKTATIATGQTSVVITVPITDDSLVESDDETVVLTLSNNILSGDEDIKIGTLQGPMVMSQQDFAGYAGAKDTFLSQSFSAVSFAAADFLSVTTDSFFVPTAASHGLIRFDNLISAGLVPPGSKIASANLNFFNTAGSPDVRLHEALLPWNPNGTWNSEFFGNGVQANGFEAAIASVLGVNSFDVTKTLQSWVDGGANNGWALLPNTLSTPWTSASSEEIDFVQNISSGNITSNVATINTVGPHGLSVGAKVVVSTGDPAFDGTFVITSAGAASLTYDRISPNSVLASSGTVNVPSPVRPKLTVNVSTSATIKIADNDSAIVKISSTTAGAEPATAAKAVISMDNKSSTPTYITYTVTDGTADVNDYSFPSGTQTITIAAGATSTTISIDVKDDALLEGTENVVVTLTGIVTGAGFSDPDIKLDPNVSNTTKTVDILDNETAVLTISATNGSENNNTWVVSSKQLTGNVATLTTAATPGFVAGQQVTVSIGDPVFDGLQVVTAVGANSFSFSKVNSNVANTPVTGTVVATAIVSSKQLVSNNTAILTTAAPHGFANGEQVLVSIGDPIFNGEHVVTVLSPTSFSYQKFNINIPVTPASGFAINQPTDGSFTITSSSASSNNTLVPYQIVLANPAHANATLGTDYVLRQGNTVLNLTATLPQFLTSTTITVDVLEDLLNEGNEIVSIKLLPPLSGHTILSASVANKELSANVATITTAAAHGFVPGQMVTVALTPADPTFDGTYAILATPTLNSFTYARVSGNVASTAVTGVVLADTAQVTIFDDDDLKVSVVATDNMVVEGADAGLNDGVLTIGLNYVSDSDVEVVYRVVTPEAGPYRSASISNYIKTPTVATLNTTAAHGFVVGQPILVNTGNVDFDGSFIVTSVPSPTQLTYNKLTVAAAAGAGGTVSTPVVLSSVVSKSLTANIASITTSAAHGFTVGQQVFVSLSTADPVFNGIYTITAVPNATTFQYSRVNADVAATATSGRAIVGNLPGAYDLAIPGTPAPGNFVNGNDYVPLPGSGSVILKTITIPAGSTSFALPVEAYQDFYDENDENVTVVLESIRTLVPTTTTVSNNANSMLDANKSSDTVVIKDEDFAITIIKTGSPAREPGLPGGFNGQFTIFVANDLPQDLVVAVEVQSSSTATIGSDYTLGGSSSPTQMVTIKAGTTSAKLDINVIDDTLSEGTETVVAKVTSFSFANAQSLTSLQIGGADTATETILDNDKLTVTVIPVNGREPGAPSDDGRFILLQNFLTPYWTKVSYEVQALSVNNATPNDDYVTISSGVRIIDPTSIAHSVEVDVLDDAFVEGDEFVKLRITNVESFTDAGLTNAAPNTGLNNVITKRVTDGGGNATVTTATAHSYVVGQLVNVVNVAGIPDGARLISSVPSNTTFTFGGAPAALPTSATSGLVSLNPSSFSVASKTLSGGVATIATPLPHGYLVGQQVVVAIGDPVFDGTFTVTAVPSPTELRYTKVASSAVSKSLTSNVATITTSTPHNFLVGQAVTVSLTTADPVFDGTYVIASVPNATSFTYVRVNADVPLAATTGTANNANVSLVAAAGTIARTINSAGSSAIVTIFDNDKTQVSLVGTQDTSEPAGSGFFAVTLDNPALTDTVVTYTITGGDAVAGQDYTHAPLGNPGSVGTVTIPAGLLQAFIEIKVIDDNIVESNPETVQVTLGSIVSASGGVSIDATKTVDSIKIFDDDIATVKITKTQDASETGPVKGIFTVSLTDALTGLSAKTSDVPTIVSYTIGGTAAPGSDYTALSSTRRGTVVIPALTTSVTIDINALDDNNVEMTETVTLTLDSVATPAPRAIQLGTVNTFNISNKLIDANVATLTTASPHTLVVGQTITVAIGDPVFDGKFVISAVGSSVANGQINRFSYARVNANIGNTAAAGTVTSANLTAVSPALNLSGNRARSGNVATLTSNNHGLAVGDRIVVSGVPDASFNGVYQVSAVTANNFSYANAGGNVSAVAVGGGTVARATEVALPNSKSLVGNVATIGTSSPHGFVPGQSVVVSINDPNFDGSFVVTGVPTPSSFTYAKPTAAISSVARQADVVEVTTIAPHGFRTGSTVSIALLVDTAGFNTASATITVVNGNTFRYNSVGINVSPVTALGDANQVSAGGAVTSGNVAIGDSVLIIDNDSTSISITSASALEGNKLADQGRATLTVSLSSAFDFETTWLVDFSNTRDIAEVQLSLNVATITSSTPHGLVVGNVVTIAGVGAPFDGTYAIASVPNSRSFTYDRISANVPATNVAVPAGIAIQSGAIGGPGDFLNNHGTFGNADYDNDQQTVTFKAGETSKTVTIHFNEEDPVTGGLFSNLVEDDEKFMTWIRPNPTTELALLPFSFDKEAASQVTIINDDTATFSINDVSFPEIATAADPVAAAVSGKTLSPSGVATITTAAPIPGLLPGDTVRVAMSPADPNFDGTFSVLAVAGNQFTYMKQAPSVASRSLTSNVATIITVAAHNYKVGDTVVVALDIPDPVFDGTYIVVSVPNSTSFTYTRNNVNVAPTAVGGNVGLSSAATPPTGNALREVAPVVISPTNKVLSSNVATIRTSGAHGLSVGQTVVVSIGDSVFDGTHVITAISESVPFSTVFDQFSYARVNSNVSSAPVSNGRIFNSLTFTLTLDNPVDMPINLWVDYTDDAGVLGAKGQTYVLFIPSPGLPAGTDYDNSRDSVSFAANNNTQRHYVTVAINPDTIIEGGTANNPGAETFTANISVNPNSFAAVDPISKVALNPQGGRLLNVSDKGTGTIIDNDSGDITLDTPDSAASENADNGQFRLKLSNGISPAVSSTDTVLTLHIDTTVTSTATPGVDYLLRVGTTVLPITIVSPALATVSVTLPAGQSEVLVDVIVLADSITEADEFVTLRVASISSGDPNIVLGNDLFLTGTVQIDDANTNILTVIASDPIGSESGFDDAAFSIQLSQPSSTDTVVFYHVLTAGEPGFVGPAATPGIDYVALSGTVTIPAGQLSATILVDVLNDSIPNEGTEYVSIFLDSRVGNAGIGFGTPRSATVQILEVLDGLFVKVEKVQDGSEPGLGPQDGQFRVTLVNAAGVPVVLPLGSTGGAGGLTVNFVLNETGSGGTASTPSDYSNVTSVVIPEGSSSNVVTIDVQDDLVPEPTETVIIRLLGTVPSALASGVTVGVATGSPTYPSVGNPLFPNLASLFIFDNDAPAPTPGAKVESLQINDGNVQRSAIRSMTVVIDSVVNAPSSAFIVRKRDDLPGGAVYQGSVGGVIATPNYATMPGKTVVTLTFVPNSTFVNSAGYLVDGNYELEIVANQVTTVVGGFQLDGNGDGFGGDNYKFGDDATDKFYVLYGDADGDEDVDFDDMFGLVFAAVGTTTATPGFKWYLDGDLDGDIDFDDMFAQVFSKVGSLRNKNGFPN